MASKAGATISNPNGFADLLAKMSEAGSESTLRQAAVAGARVIHAEVQMRAPLGSVTHTRSGKVYPPGTLRKSIALYHDDDKSSVAKALQVYGVTVGRDAFYGLMVEDGHDFSGFVAKHAKQTEFGTSRVAAHPFFRPAVDAKSREAIDAMTAVMQKKLDEAKNG